MAGEYAKVRILDVPYHSDKIFEYFIPPALTDAVIPGCLVNVGFGAGNRKCAAIVTEVSDKRDGNYQIKPIFSVSSDSPVLTPDEIALCRFMCDYTLCTFGEAVRCVVPQAAMSRINYYYRYVCEPSDAKRKKLSEKAISMFAFIRGKEKVSFSTLKSQYGDETLSIVATLIRAGVIEREAQIKESSNVRYLTYARLAVSKEEAEAASVKCSRSPLQKAILDRLIEKNGEEEEASSIFSAIGSSATVQLSSLAKKGLVELRKKEIYRNPYLEACNNRDVYENSSLSHEQKRAVDTLTALADCGEPRGALLHGVTGSGKTRVIKAMIDKMTERGRGVIVLVPEISLTPQTVGIFCSCYGERVAVIHSALSQGEKFDAWRRIRRGDADIVIGTRSAVFAPVKNLGMIVIDEEQEHTYKSDTDPKYHAHDIARYRCTKTNALMLLASATPSLTSYYKAKNGSYTLVELTRRYGEAKLPDVMISDMRLDRDTGNPSPVGISLYSKLLETVKNKKQAIVFLNRRGYNSAISCRICGEAIKCPHCSVSLTYHIHQALGTARDPQDYLDLRARKGSLACHYCGYKTGVPKICPTCGAEHFRYMGCGTQQAEEEIGRLIPGAKIMRMDMDTTSTKQAFDNILDAFRNKKADILLGTQMVTKGHDFPGVTLVGVMNADSSLFLDDYRASERTFDMLTQVIGRAGRGEDRGIAVIQTLNPDSPIIRLAAAQDYKTFYESEINVRRALTFPPFCDIVALNITSGDEALLNAASKAVSEMLRNMLINEFNDVKAEVFGPFEAPVYKIQNCYRMRLIIKCRLNRRSREMLARLMREVGAKTTRKITVTADLNPTTL